MTETEHDLTTWPGWLKELRHRHGWTQEELAKRLSASRPSVARWETGNSQPMPVYRKVLGYLGKEKRMPAPPAHRSHSVTSKS